MSKTILKTIPALLLGVFLMNATAPVVAQTTTSFDSSSLQKVDEWFTWSEAGGTAVAGGVGGAAGGAVAGAMAGGVGAGPGALAGGVGGAVAGAVGNIVGQAWSHYVGNVQINDARTIDFSTALN